MIKKPLLQDMQHKIKDHFRGVPDEFMFNENALKAKVDIFTCSDFCFQNIMQCISVTLVL